MSRQHARLAAVILHEIDLRPGASGRAVTNAIRALSGENRGT
jgi:hypothetical protein